MESTIFTAIDYASQINDLLFSLKADTTYNAYSGLTAENVPDSEAVVKIFDDYDSAEYYADQVIDALKSVAAINWSEHDNTQSAFDPIWDSISGAQI